MNIICCKQLVTFYSNTFIPYVAVMNINRSISSNNTCSNIQKKNVCQKWFSPKWLLPTQEHQLEGICSLVMLQFWVVLVDGNAVMPGTWLDVFRQELWLNHSILYDEEGHMAYWTASKQLLLWETKVMYNRSILHWITMNVRTTGAPWRMMQQKAILIIWWLIGHMTIIYQLPLLPFFCTGNTLTATYVQLQRKGTLLHVIIIT